MAAAKEIPVAATGSIWASANQTLSWNSNQMAPSVWGNMPATNCESRELSTRDIL